MLAIGIDSGTKSTRALVLDIEAGKVLALSQRQHDFIENLPHGHVAQLPDTWVAAADQTVRECLTAIGPRKEAVAAIGVRGQQPGLIVLEERNQPIRPAKLWCDTSAADEADELNKIFGTTEQM